MQAVRQLAIKSDQPSKTEEHHWVVGASCALHEEKLSEANEKTGQGFLRRMFLPKGYPDTAAWSAEAEA